MGGFYKKEQKTGTPPMGEEGGSKEGKKREGKRAKTSAAHTHG